MGRCPLSKSILLDMPLHACYNGNYGGFRNGPMHFKVERFMTHRRVGGRADFIDIIDRSENIIMDSKPDKILRWSDYQLPIVYAWKRGNEWLYIGKSGVGLYRVFNHSVIGRKEKIQSNDSVLIWFCDYNKIDSLERQMIKKYQPKYNIMGVRAKSCSICKSKYRGKTCPTCEKSIREKMDGTNITITQV
jgi:hypothetical protein